MFGRLALTAFALWWGYNAIQMFSCDAVRWAGRRAYCTSAGSAYPSGSSTGGFILLVVVAVLLWLWVWPFVRFRRATQAASYHAQRASAATGIPAETIYNQMLNGNLTPGEWAIAHDLDPYTFKPRE